jgi:uncharacterized PurR-regulated membrane protein YhhQ (DUF165 family)
MLGIDTSWGGFLFPVIFGEEMCVDSTRENYDRVSESLSLLAIGAG